MRDLTQVFAEIDQANSADPTTFDGRPLAEAQGELATAWLGQLSDEPSAELQVACRAHHLRRWELMRADYPEGRAGYLRWRRDNKAHQANCIVEILEPAGWLATDVNRVQQLLLRKGLGTDPETQMLEDVACLVFVETQFEEMSGRIESERMVNVVAKTLKKMSPAAIELAARHPLPQSCQNILGQAVQVLEDEA